jgi:hypothetical protein
MFSAEPHRPLPQGLRATGLLNDLVTLTAIWLSSLNGHLLSSRGGRRPSQGSGRKAGVRVEWSDTTDNARHDADPFGDEGRQGKATTLR